VGPGESAFLVRLRPLFCQLGVAFVIACATWRCHASALFLDATDLTKKSDAGRFFEN
jgi:hypothetical protein